MSEFLRVERTGPVATVWIDRQAKMNTMTVAMRNEFPGIFRDLEADDARARGHRARGGGQGLQRGRRPRRVPDLGPGRPRAVGRHL